MNRGPATGAPGANFVFVASRSNPAATLNIQGHEPMSLTRYLFLASGVLVAVPPIPAAGQEPPAVLRPGESVEARLTPDGPTLGGRPFRAYRFDGQAGTLYEISLSATDFEPRLRLGREVSGVTDYVMEGGYHGLGSTATLYYRSEESGPYLVVVQGGDGGVGTFTLTLTEPGDRDALPLELGNVVSAAVSEEVLHPFRGRAGSELLLTARSRDFDTVLEIGMIRAGAFVRLMEDDDGGGGTDSRIYFVPQEDGEFVARVRAYDSSEDGGYAILLSEPPILPDPAPLVFGQEIRGELTDASPRTEDGFPFAHFSIDAPAGTRLLIDARSNDFDTYLSVGRIEGRRFVEMAANDDALAGGLSGTDSRLMFVVPDGGEHVVWVRPFEQDGRGTYSALVSVIEDALTEPAGGDVAVDQTVEGELTDRDAILEDGTPYQEWRFRAAEGQRIELLLTSGDFDTYLQVGAGSGTGFQILAENDDSPIPGMGTDSRLIFTAPAAGEYTARIQPFYGEDRGAYRLSLREAPPLRERPVEGRIGVGDAVVGIIDEQDARLPEGVPHQLWYFTGTAGNALLIEMSSGELDAYLSVGRMTNGRFEELAQNDDFGASTDARVVFIPPADGEYVIVARPYYPDEIGRYTLRLGAAP